MRTVRFQITGWYDILNYCHIFFQYDSYSNHFFLNTQTTSTSYVPRLNKKKYSSKASLEFTYGFNLFLAYILKIEANRNTTPFFYTNFKRPMQEGFRTKTKNTVGFILRVKRQI